MNWNVRVFFRVMTLTVLGLLLFACAQTVATTEDVGQVQSTSLGAVLVAPDGMTLYTFDEDADRISNCTGLCAEAWPPLMASDGAEATDGFSVIARSSGGMQWAYNGQPLYLYYGDSNPGDVSGDGIDGVWHVAQP